MQQRIIDAMVESGASAEDVAKSVVQLKLLEAIGEAPEKMAKVCDTYNPTPTSTSSSCKLYCYDGRARRTFE